MRFPVFVGDQCMQFPRSCPRQRGGFRRADNIQPLFIPAGSLHFPAGAGFLPFMTAPGARPAMPDESPVHRSGRPDCCQRHSSGRTPPSAPRTSGDDNRSSQESPDVASGLSLSDLLEDVLQFVQGQMENGDAHSSGTGCCTRKSCPRTTKTTDSSPCCTSKENPCKARSKPTSNSPMDPEEARTDTNTEPEPTKRTEDVTIKNQKTAEKLAKEKDGQQKSNSTAEPLQWTHSVLFPGFAANEIQVKVKDRRIVIHARKEKVAGPSTCLSRVAITESVLLPESADRKSLSCSFSQGGRLLLRAPMLPQGSLENGCAAETEKLESSAPKSKEESEMEAVDNVGEKMEALENKAECIYALENKMTKAPENSNEGMENIKDKELKETRTEETGASATNLNVSPGCLKELSNKVIIDQTKVEPTAANEDATADEDTEAHKQQQCIEEDASTEEKENQDLSPLIQEPDSSSEEEEEDDASQTFVMLMGSSDEEESDGFVDIVTTSDRSTTDDSNAKPSAEEQSFERKSDAALNSTDTSEDTDPTPPIKRNDGQLTDRSLGDDKSHMTIGNTEESKTTEQMPSEQPQGDFKVCLPLSEFKPEDVLVKLENHTLSITAERLSTLGGDIAVTESAHKKVDLPAHLDMTTVRCVFDRGQLIITACPNKSASHQVPVEVV